MSEAANVNSEVEPDTKLVMKFDPNTIQHLGISMYSTLPPVLGELVANAYDANASKVDVYLYDNIDPKQIIVSDDGDGMTFSELNDKYLRIWSNRKVFKDKYTKIQ